MNCADFNNLIDAYLDGDLGGSLRLEFDAHRLHCRRCQLTAVMMESVATVVANDRPPVSLSDDFTSRVLHGIERRRPLSLRLRPTRVAIVAGALLQAAAVLLLAIWLPGRGVTGAADRVSESPVPAAPVALVTDSLSTDYAEVDRRSAQREAYVDYIMQRMESAGASFASELNQLGQYVVALPVPEDVARAADGIILFDTPRLLEAISPPFDAPEAETGPANQHSL